jgi:hypothetical protein
MLYQVRPVTITPLPPPLLITAQYAMSCCRDPNPAADVSKHQTTAPQCTVLLSSKGYRAGSDGTFEFGAQTTARNAARTLRGMQLHRAILLEGSPGVGKTALVAALASSIGSQSCHFFPALAHLAT